MKLEQSTGEQNKGQGSTFQPPEEGLSIQWLKCDKHGNKDEDNSLKNKNNYHRHFDSVFAFA